MKRIFLIAAMLVFTGAAFAGGASIEGFKAEYGSELRLSFAVEGAFTPDIMEAIHSGMPTTFVFIIKLDRKRGFFLDEHIGTWKFSHTVKYDALKNEYAVQMGEKNSTERTKDEERMRELMAGVESVAVSPLPALQKGETYEAGITAELDTLKIPFPFKYLFFFLKLWDFKTARSYAFSI
jgi:hypothetical protein